MACACVNVMTFMCVRECMRIHAFTCNFLSSGLTMCMGEYVFTCVCACVNPSMFMCLHDYVRTFLCVCRMHVLG